MNSKINRTDSVDGILLVDKEPGWTSQDVCAFIRSRYRIKRVGHAGTLDPSATGLLVILLGKATKLSESLSGRDKKYQGQFRLGVETDSYDAAGKVVAEKNYETISDDQIFTAVQQLTGEIEQEPPMVSALQQNGVRLYKLARQGKVVDRPKRKVSVYEFTVQKINLPLLDITVHVSKGTYVRTLAHDLGRMLGCGAILQNLRRLTSGEFSVDHAVSIAELKKMMLKDIQEKSSVILNTYRQAGREGSRLAGWQVRS